MDPIKSYQIKAGYKCNPLNPDKETFSIQQDERLGKVAQYYVYKAAWKLARGIQGKVILDVGSGMGLKLRHFFRAGFEVFGVDTAAAIALSKKAMPEGVFVEEDLQAPRFEMKKHLAKADIIICADVIEHVEDPDTLLNYIKQFADKGTLIVLSTPDREHLHGKSNSQPRNPFHIREWSSVEFRNYITASGFDILEHETIFSNQVRLDLPTLEWFLGKFLRGNPLKHTQLIICKSVPT